jgi:hypothetical protein
VNDTAALSGREGWSWEIIAVLSKKRSPIAFITGNACDGSTPTTAAWNSAASFGRDEKVRH